MHFDHHYYGITNLFFAKVPRKKRSQKNLQDWHSHFNHALNRRWSVLAIIFLNRNICTPFLGLADWASGLAGWPRGGEWTDGRTDEWTNGWKISPFYRTSSPIGAAALPPPMKTKEKVEQGKGTADHLMPLSYLLGFHEWRQGSGPDRGQSPVEWGDFPSVRPSLRPFPPLGHPASPEAQPASPEVQPARPEAQPARPEAQRASQPQASSMAGWASGLAGWPSGGDERKKLINEWTNRKSPHSKGLHPRVGPTDRQMYQPTKPHIELLMIHIHIFWVTYVLHDKRINLPISSNSFLVTHKSTIVAFRYSKLFNKANSNQIDFLFLKKAFTRDELARRLKFWCKSVVGSGKFKMTFYFFYK